MQLNKEINFIKRETNAGLKFGDKMQES